MNIAKCVFTLQPLSCDATRSSKWKLHLQVWQLGKDHLSLA